MVANITSLTGHGLKDWLVQRVSALVLGVFTCFLLGFIFIHGGVSYKEWHQLFSCGAMKVFTAVSLLSLVLHAWVGIWTVTTDYLNCVCLRLSAQVAVCLALIACFIWGIAILWGASI